MSEFRIPSRFKLFAETIKVLDDPSLIANHHWDGSANYHKAEIRIVPSSDAFPSTRVRYEQIFCHELVHQIATSIGLELDEKDVDLFGRALHQAVTTMEYDK